MADHATLLQEGGFEIGQLIERKADRVMAKLDRVAGNKAVLLLQDGPLSGWATVSVASLLKGEWKKAAPKVDPVELPDFHGCLPTCSRELCLMQVKGSIAGKLLDLEKKHIKVHDGLKVFLKPMKAVIAQKRFGKGELVLVPSTTKIVTEQPQSGVCLGSVGLAQEIESADISLWLAPCTILPKEGGLKQPFVAPFWFVRSTSVKEDANCEVVPVMDSDHPNHLLKVPFLRNFKPIKSDEELLCFAEKVAKQASVEALTQMTPEPPTKRRRGKGQAV